MFLRAARMKEIIGSLVSAKARVMKCVLPRNALRKWKRVLRQDRPGGVHKRLDLGNARDEVSVFPSQIGARSGTSLMLRLSSEHRMDVITLFEPVSHASL